jgi:uncharacterized protein (TIGR02231 family)
MPSPPTPVSAPISEVAVFLDRARITRSGEITLALGESVLAIAGLPTTLHPDSVRVKARGAGIRIISIDVASVQLVQTPDVNAAEVSAKLEERENKQKELNDVQAVQQERQKMVAATRVTGSVDLVKGLAWGRTSIESLQALSAYADREDAACRAELREIAAQLKAVQREIDALRSRLKQLHQPASVQRRVIHITVEADNADSAFAFDVSYTCSGATWTPLYDLRLTGEKLRVTYLASVNQNTGEDWSDIQLALSTARPAVTTTIPELSPWYLSVPSPPVQVYQASFGGGGGMAPQEVMSRMAAPAAAATPMPAAPPPAVESIQATVEENGASATFRIPRRASIPSDKTPHRVQIAEFDLPAKLDYITAPKVAEQAYLRATIRNDSHFVLLPGKANLFHGEEYVGVTRLEDTAAAEFELQMGVDERVSVTRELISRDVSKTFIGNTRRTAFNYRIRIQHRLDSGAKILVIDQIPHSRHEEIKVKLNDTSPRTSEVTDLSELRWKLSLEKGKDVEITFGFTVEYPKHLTVLGLHD